MNERVMGLNTSFENNLVTRARVTVDLRETSIIVGRRRRFLEPSKARLLATILDNTRKGAWVSQCTLSHTLGYSGDSCFQRAYKGLLSDLTDMSIANEGGNGGALEEPTIFAPALLLRQDNKIGFNAALAAKISTRNVVSDRGLSELRASAVNRLAVQPV